MATARTSDHGVTPPERGWFRAVFTAEGRGRLTGARLVMSQFVLVFVAFLFYLGVRGVTKGQQAIALDHAHRVLHFEDDLQLNWERGAQAFILGRSSLRSFFNAVYVWTYWPMVLGTLILLWRWDRRRFAIFRDGLILSGLIGLVIFALYPVAPPGCLTASKIRSTRPPASTSSLIRKASSTALPPCQASTPAGWRWLGFC